MFTKPTNPIKNFLLILSMSCLFSVKAVGANYYWIGGSGNWTDLTHWATTSGGTSFYNQIPTANDDVFFDANSFTAPGQVVNLNALTMFVRDMTWTGVTNSPTLTGANVNLLRISGSLTFVTGMNLNFLGPVNFEATTLGKTITMAGKSFFNAIIFNGSGGGWVLLDAFTTSGGLSFNNGNLNTNDQTVNVNQFFSISVSSRVLNLGSSIINLSSSFDLWWVSSLGMTFNAGTSTINATANAAGVSAVFHGGDLTYYDLNFTGSNGIEGRIEENNIFHNVSFAAHGTIRGSNTFNNLSFSPGYTYVLGIGRTQIISGSFFAAGNCNRPITINSTISGSRTSISHPTGNVIVTNVVLKDINATGGASFIANNTVDLGNNAGWTINALASQNLYWIGNGGNWDDGNHWSLTSGGAPVGCPPTALDNVFFDGNSFSLVGQSILINVPTASCRDMTWLGVSNNPNLAGPSTSLLKVYGSTIFESGMNLLFNGLVYFEATAPGKTITTAGKSFIDAVYFNGIGGEWTLQDPFISLRPIYLNNGILNTNNQTVTAEAFKSRSSTARTLNMGSSVFNLSFPTSNSVLSGFWDVGNTMSLNCGTSTINSTGNVPLSSAVFNGAGFTYYNLSFTGTNAQGGIVRGTNIFHDVSFASNGSIIDDNIYNNLTFAPGFTYVLANGRTQTINGSLNAQGNCNGLVTINTSVSGSQSTLSHLPGNVTISHVALKDTRVIGGANFVANNAVDLGNNTGWNINPLAGRNLYWIGNSGNWDDGNHWSLASGGPPAGCPPTALDNVFFDINSFATVGQTVLINVPTASCKDMTWNGVINNPMLAGPTSSTLKIYGSLTFVAGMNLSFAGPVSFEASATGKTISTSGKSFSNIITFNGIGGAWILNDAFNTTSSVYLNNGTLSTNNKTVNASAFISISGAIRALNMGSSLFNLSLTSNANVLGFWNVISTGLTLNCGTSTINATGNTVGAVAEFWGGQNLTYYDLNFTGSNNGGGIIYDLNYFHNVSFSSNGIIYSNNTYNNLTFTAGCTYRLNADQTQTVTGQLRIQGNCASYIFLQSTIPGMSSTIIKTTGTILGFNIHMRDIRAIGGATFTAYNSVDLGGNTGWNFLVLPPLANPEPIVGPTTSCEGTTGVTYYIPPTFGAISYFWAVPSGATITSGQGDTLITVSFTTAAVGNITVSAFSGCLYSLSRTLGIEIFSAQPPTVSISANPSGSICAGSLVIFTATPNNAVTPSYQWQLNGSNVGTNSPTYTSGNLANGDIVSAIITSTNTCAPITTATSNTITITVNPIVMPSVIVVAGSTTICAGSLVSFTATPTNGGAAPAYQWQLNGASIVGANASTYSSSTLANGDVVSVILTSNATCPSHLTASSNTVSMTVNPILNPSVIAATGTTIICPGTTVSFTATPTNGGTAPAYQWQVNGVNVGTNSSTYSSSSLANGDVVRVILTSNAICPFAPTTSSNAIIMTVNPILTPSVIVAAGTTTVCPGTPVSFTATPINGGTAPSYQWQVNGVDVSTNSPTYSSSSLTNGDIVTVILTSNAACLSTSTANSNTVIMTVNPILTPSVNVAGAISICAGSPTSFIATPTNGGSSPAYQWRVNGINTGNNSPTYSTSTLVNGDVVSVILTSNASCVSTPSATSNTIAMNVVPVPITSVSIAAVPLNICYRTLTTFTATTVNGGSFPSYQWKLNGLSVGSNDSTFSINSLVDGDIITCLVKSNLACAATGFVNSNNITVAINPSRCATGFFMPTAFTPNNDGKNDLCKPMLMGKIISYSFSIYNRWGQQVFETADWKKGWDGKVSGLPADTNIFVWFSTFQFEGLEKTTQRGTVTLIR